MTNNKKTKHVTTNLGCFGAVTSNNLLKIAKKNI